MDFTEEDFNNANAVQWFVKARLENKDSEKKVWFEKMYRKYLKWARAQSEARAEDEMQIEDAPEDSVGAEQTSAAVQPRGTTRADELERILVAIQNGAPPQLSKEELNEMYASMEMQIGTAEFEKSRFERLCKLGKKHTAYCKYILDNYTRRYDEAYVHLESWFDEVQSRAIQQIRERHGLTDSDADGKKLVEFTSEKQLDDAIESIVYYEGQQSRLREYHTLKRLRGLAVECAEDMIRFENSAFVYHEIKWQDIWNYHLATLDMAADNEDKEGVDVLYRGTAPYAEPGRQATRPQLRLQSLIDRIDAQVGVIMADKKKRDRYKIIGKPDSLQEIWSRIKLGFQDTEKYKRIHAAIHVRLQRAVGEEGGGLSKAAIERVLHENTETAFSEEERILLRAVVASMHLSNTVTRDMCNNVEKYIKRNDEKERHYQHFLIDLIQEQENKDEDEDEDEPDDFVESNEAFLLQAQQELESKDMSNEERAEMQARIERERLELQVAEEELERLRNRRIMKQSMLAQDSSEYNEDDMIVPDNPDPYDTLYYMDAVPVRDGRMLELVGSYDALRELPLMHMHWWELPEFTMRSHEAYRHAESLVCMLHKNEAYALDSIEYGMLDIVMSNRFAFDDGFGRGPQRVWYAVVLMFFNACLISLRWQIEQGDPYRRMLLPLKPEDEEAEAEDEVPRWGRGLSYEDLCREQFAAIPAKLDEPELHSAMQNVIMLAALMQPLWRATGDSHQQQSFRKYVPFGNCTLLALANMVAWLDSKAATAAFVQECVYMGIVHTDYKEQFRQAMDSLVQITRLAS
jgi:hypothetical protein